MITSGNDRQDADKAGTEQAEQKMEQLLKAEPPIDDLHGAIQHLIELFDVASELAKGGEQVNIDLLAMRVAVLCDAICEADPTISRPFRQDLEKLLGHLNLLENTLRRERVHLALNVEAADRRQRAKLAYGRVLPSMSSPTPPRRPDDQTDE